MNYINKDIWGLLYINPKSVTYYQFKIDQYQVISIDIN